MSWVFCYSRCMRKKSPRPMLEIVIGNVMKSFFKLLRPMVKVFVLSTSRTQAMKSWKVPRNFIQLRVDFLQLICNTKKRK
jgi:hypothetical protein